jgi:hypothetical protein
MIWISRIGLILLCFFLAFLYAAGSDLLVVLQWAGLVAILGLWAELSHRDRKGRTAISGFSKLRAAIFFFALGILSVLMTILTLSRDSYLAAAYNAFGAVLAFVIGGLILLPNPALERARRKRWWLANYLRCRRAAQRER